MCEVRYTGDSATGSITDSVTVAVTGNGKIVSLAGPASKLGKLVGFCARRAVAEALLKQEPIWANRNVPDRLRERHLPLEKLAAEVSKVEGLAVDAKGLAEILKKNPSASAFLLAAAKMDDDYKKNLLPTDIDGWEAITSCFSMPLFGEKNCAKRPNYDTVNLPPFLKYALIKLIKDAQSGD